MNHEGLADRTREVIRGSAKQYRNCPRCGGRIRKKACICPLCNRIVRMSLGAKATLAVLAFLISIPLLNSFNRAGDRFWSWVQYERGGSGTRAAGPLMIPKKDGAFDAGHHDLEGLCKEWLFYRKRTLAAAKEGDAEKAAKYRERFQRTNIYLRKYPDKDVAAMIAALEEKGYSP